MSVTRECLTRKQREGRDTEDAEEEHSGRGDREK